MLSVKMSLFWGDATASEKNLVGVRDENDRKKRDWLASGPATDAERDAG